MGKNEMSCDCDIIHHDKVEKLKKKVKTQEIINDMTKLYKTMADDTRMKIIDILKEDEVCVCDISVLLNMTKSAVSHQLRYLRENNLVKFRKEGKVVLYSLADEHVEKMYTLCLEHIMEK